MVRPCARTPLGLWPGEFDSSLTSLAEGAEGTVISIGSESRTGEEGDIFIVGVMIGTVRAPIALLPVVMGWKFAAVVAM